jgi:hypothetical protein
MNKVEMDKEISEILSTPIRGNHAHDWQLIGRCNDFIDDKDNPRELRKMILKYATEVICGEAVSDNALEAELDREEGEDE